MLKNVIKKNLNKLEPSATLAINDKSKEYYKKVIKPTEEQLKLHKDYLKTSLKKNFFN